MVSDTAIEHTNELSRVESSMPRTLRPIATREKATITIPLHAQTTTSTKRRQFHGRRHEHTNTAMQNAATATGRTDLLREGNKNNNPVATGTTDVHSMVGGVRGTDIAL